MHKYMALVALLFSSNIVIAQDSSSVEYFDSLLNKSTAEAAYYKIEYKKNGASYEAIIYIAKTGVLKSTNRYIDPTYKIRSGLSCSYYESGQLEDSTFYKEDKMLYSYYYHPNGNNWVVYRYDPVTGKETTRATDANGAPINPFIFTREADFPGGEDAWLAFLSSNINSKVPIKKKAPAGRYSAVVQFVVEPDGRVSNVIPITNLGYGIEEELMRVIKKSPKWIPAVKLNKTVKAWRRQPLTLVVPD